MSSDARLVARMFDAVSRRVHASAASRDLPAGQWAILRHLKQHHRYGRTAEQVAVYFSEPLVIINHTLTSLARKRLLIADGAVETSNTRYALTAAGEERLDDDPVEHAANAIAQMSASDRAEFCRLLELMLAGLAKAD